MRAGRRCPEVVAATSAGGGEGDGCSGGERRRAAEPLEGALGGLVGLGGERLKGRPAGGDHVVVVRRRTDHEPLAAADAQAESGVYDEVLPDRPGPAGADPDALQPGGGPTAGGGEMPDAERTLQLLAWLMAVRQGKRPS